MIVDSTAITASIKLINTQKDVLQSFSRINPALTQANLTTIRNFFNNLRRSDQTASGGHYAVVENLTRR